MADRFGYGEIGLDINPCRGCEDYDAPDGCKSNGGCGRTQTNADRIRRMSDEELVEIFANNDCGYCRIHDFCFAKGNAINCDDVWLEWLKEEANDVS